MSLAFLDKKENSPKLLFKVYMYGRSFNFYAQGREVQDRLENNDNNDFFIPTFVAKYAM